MRLVSASSNYFRGYLKGARSLMVYRVDLTNTVIGKQLALDAKQQAVTARFAADIKP
ncbi:MAG: hypothetical protein JJU26_06200 [Oceanicaulis sp.]|nr:hypothetical protein [Oceanicaulis sp.]